MHAATHVSLCLFVSAPLPPPPPSPHDLSLLSLSFPLFHLCTLNLQLMIHGRTLPHHIVFRSRPLIGIERDRLDEQVFEEEFSPVRRRTKSAGDIMKMLKPPEPVLSAIK